MKRYNFKIRKLREADTEISRFDEDVDVLITSDKFIEEFRVYVEDIARYKTVKGRKFPRSTEYAAIGIMDMNDLVQEAYLAFLESYKSYVESKGSFENGAAVWSYIKKSTALNLDRQLRNKKDGIRVTEHALFKSKSVNTNLLTTLFNQLDRLFFRNQEDVEMTKWETELVGAFMEVHFDEFLDLTREGNRDTLKNERAIMKALYGIDQPVKTYKELSEVFRISQSTIRSVKERAIKRLRSEESKQKIAYFLHEYRINTQADTEKYRK